MISYTHTVFCRGDGCTKFSFCPLALTDEVKKKAQAWWRGPNPPISQCAHPRKMACYEDPEPCPASPSSHS